MLKGLRNGLSPREVVLFRLAIWTCLVVWMVLFFAFSIVMAGYFAGLGPDLFGEGFGGQVMTWVLPVWTVFTSMLIIVFMARFANKKLGKDK